MTKLEKQIYGVFIKSFLLGIIITPILGVIGLAEWGDFPYVFTSITVVLGAYFLIEADDNQ